MNDQQIKELFPFYALGTLSKEERDQVDHFVATRPSARTELDEMIASAAELAYLAKPVPGTEADKAAFMERIRNDSKARQSETAVIQTESFLEKLQRRLLPRPMPAFAALSLILVVLFIWSLSMRAQLGDLNDQIAELESDLTTLDNERLALQSTANDLVAENIALMEQIQNQQQILVALGRSDTVTVAVDGTESDPSGGGFLVVNTNEGVGFLSVTGLSPIAANQNFQLWLIQGDNPISAGVFTLEEPGQSTYSFTIDAASLNFDAVGVSIEPAGGSPQPTGDIVLFGSRSS